MTPEAPSPPVWYAVAPPALKGEPRHLSEERDGPEFLGIAGGTRVCRVDRDLRQPHFVGRWMGFRGRFVAGLLEQVDELDAPFGLDPELFE